MKIGIVGVGMVGSCAAFGLVMSGVGSEIVLVDMNKVRVEAEREDLSHAAPFSNPLAIQVGDVNSLQGAGIVILAAGVSQKPGEPRIALLDRNAKVFASIVPAVVRAAPEAILIVATNPVDIMTFVATRLANAPEGRVFGSGTILDTARFESLLARHLGVSSQSLDAFVLGQHGDSKVLHWSGATAGTIPVRDLAEDLGRPLTHDIRNDMDARVRDAANRIIEGKGSTYYGIAAGLARLCEAIVNNQKEIFTVSMLTEFGEIRDTALSLPRIIGAKGVEATLYPNMTPGELQALEESAAIIKQATDAIHIDLDTKVTPTDGPKGKSVKKESSNDTTKVDKTK